tara:strand:- start:178 stop:372 length:195 start_codon:yes stop_codon:yes gene_type:complete
MSMHDLKDSFIQCLIVLIPTYAVAFFTEMMVYTIPMLAATSFIANNVRQSQTAVRNDAETIDYD